VAESESKKAEATRLRFRQWWERSSESKVFRFQKFAPAYALLFCS
jgi:hypothetical protein